MGFWNEFMDFDRNQVEFIGVEAGGPKKSKYHAAPLTNNSKNWYFTWCSTVCDSKQSWTNRKNRVNKRWIRLSWNFSDTLFFERH